MTASMVLGLVAAADPAPAPVAASGPGGGPATDALSVSFGATFGAIVASLMPPPPVAPAAPLELVLAADWQPEHGDDVVATEGEEAAEAPFEPAPVRLDGEVLPDEDESLVPLEKGLANWITRVAGQAVRREGRSRAERPADSADPDLPPVVGGRREFARNLDGPEARERGESPDVAGSRLPAPREFQIPAELSAATTTLLTLAASTLWPTAGAAVEEEAMTLPVPPANVTASAPDSPALPDEIRPPTGRTSTADQRVALARYQGGDQGLDPETLLAMRANHDPGIEIGGFMFPVDDEGTGTPQRSVEGPQLTGTVMRRGVAEPDQAASVTAEPGAPVDRVARTVPQSTQPAPVDRTDWRLTSRAPADPGPIGAAAPEAFSAPNVHRERPLAPNPSATAAQSNADAPREWRTDADGSHAESGTGDRQGWRSAASSPTPHAAHGAAPAATEFRVPDEVPATPTPSARTVSGEQDQTARIARRVDNLMVDLRDESGDLGRLKVSVRGPNVRATILPNDQVLADRLNLGIRDLRQSLEERGFTDPRITIQAPVRRDLQGWLPAGRDPQLDVAAFELRQTGKQQPEQDRNRPDDPRQDSRQDGGRSSHRSRDHRQGRQGGQS